MSNSKKHHYLPQHILNNFSVDNDGRQIWVLNKEQEISYKSSIRNAGSENHFNSFMINGEGLNFENYFDKNDSMSGIIVRKIIESNSLQCQDTDEFMALSSLVVVQQNRTSFMRNNLQKLFNVMCGKVLSLSGLKLKSDKAKEQLEQIKEYKDVKGNQKKALHYLFLIDHIELIKNALTDKKVFLMQCSNADNFIIGDNPILILSNKQMEGSYGNVGLAVPGVKIYYPISSKLTLAFYCPSILMKFNLNLIKVIGQIMIQLKNTVQ